jgi:tetratricopeptide (TPR) repeat protein
LPKHQFDWSELSGVRTGDMKFIEAPEPELYRLRDDPGETRNLAAAEPELATRLRRVVTSAAAAHAVPARRVQSDMAAAEKLLALGYLGQVSNVPVARSSSRPDPKSKLEVYGLVMSSLTMSETGRPDAALEALAEAERQEPDLTHIHYLKGVILGGQERYREAADALERAVALSPRHVLARFKLALAYLRLGNDARAEAVLKSVLADEPRNMRAYQNLAALAYARGNLAHAEEMARRAVDIDPGYFDAWNTLGAVYLMTKRPADAVEALNKAVAIRPQSAQAHHNLALAHSARGETAAAATARYSACKLDANFCR